MSFYKVLFEPGKEKRINLSFIIFVETIDLIREYSKGNSNVE